MIFRAVTDWKVDALHQSLSARPLSHAEMFALPVSRLAFLRYPAFSCGVQRKRTTAVAGSLMGGLPRGRLGLSMPRIMWLQIFLDKWAACLFNVATLNKEIAMELILIAVLVAVGVVGVLGAIFVTRLGA